MVCVTSGPLFLLQNKCKKWKRENRNVIRNLFFCQNKCLKKTNKQKWRFLLVILQGRALRVVIRRTMIELVMNRERRQIEGCNSSVLERHGLPALWSRSSLEPETALRRGRVPLTAILTLQLEGSGRREHRKSFPGWCGENSVMRVTLPKGTPRAPWWPA